MPTKAAYLRLERNPEIEFEHFLAEKLGMTRAALRYHMGQDELLDWWIYYARKAQRAEMQRLKG